MRKIKFIFNLLFIFLFSSCKKENETPPIIKSSEAKLVSFTLLNIAGTIDNQKKEVLITLPAFTEITSLIATFEVSAGAVLLQGSNPQISKTTANNYSNALVFNVKAEDGTIASYTVIVAITKSNEAKLLTFNFKKDKNPTILSADVVGCLKQNAITLSTPITDLVSPNPATVTPSFTLSKGAKLLLNGVELESDKTAIKVTSAPTEIVVKAEDGTEQKYSLQITSRILNVQNFLSICPKDDPAFAQIIKDFEIRKNGVKLTILDFDCDDKKGRAMRLLQTLRMYYYVDLYKPKGYLPFTNLRLYDWLKAEVKGFNIKDDLTAAGACCTVDQGKKYMLLRTEKTESAAVIQYNYTEWAFLAGYFSLIGHERRHAEPTGYPHTGKCNDVVGDEDYNEANLGAYGVAYWLSKAFKTGVLEVGVSCLTKQKQDEINNLTGENGWAARYFCKNAPPISWPANYAACACQ